MKSETDEKVSKQMEEKMEEKILKLYLLYKKLFEESTTFPKESLEEKIERVNPFYTKNKTLTYVGE